MTNDRITIGLISPTDIEDRRASSGTIFKIADSLKRLGYEVKWIKVKYNRMFDKVNRIVNITVKRICGLDFNYINRLRLARYASSSIDAHELRKCDILLFPFQSYAMYGLKFIKPVIYLSDATFDLMVDYYIQGLGHSDIKVGNTIERYAMDNSDVIILSSDWAAKSAIQFYKQPQSKVHIIEFGANIDDSDIIIKEFCYKGQLDLLFLGVDWERKGGHIAVDACRHLNEIGCKATLHIVGVKDLDVEIRNLPYINYLGFLNKNDPAQYRELVTVIKKCHCLLLPTIAECSAIAFAESSAYGLPIFSHDTGGVANYVYNGTNGYLLPLGATGEDFAIKIKECLDNGELKKMSSSAVQVYKNKLNWQTWSLKVCKIINELMEGKQIKC